MPRPKRSLLFLWVPEWHGTMAYIDEHPGMAGPALGGSHLANMNLDMVGEHPELLHSRMYITRTPASVPSALNDVVENMAQMVERMNVRTPRGSLSEFNYRVTPYSGGSDHMMFIDRGIPGMMFTHSDYTHHTSEDTPDKVDPVELERSEIIATAALLYLSDLSAVEALDLTYLVGANAAGRLGAAARRARLRLREAAASDADRAWFEAENAVRQTSAWEREAVSSVLHFQDADPVRAEVERVQRGLDRRASELLAAIGEEARALGGNRPVRGEPVDRRIPVRETRGPLDFDLPASRLPEADAAWYAATDFPLGSGSRFELVNFIDGTRSVTQIRDALSGEFGSIPTAVVARYLDDLVKVGVLSWR